MGGQEIMIDAREIIKPLHLGSAGNFEQIAITRVVFSQQQQVR